MSGRGVEAKFLLLRDDNVLVPMAPTQPESYCGSPMTSGPCNRLPTTPFASNWDLSSRDYRRQSVFADGRNRIGLDSRWNSRARSGSRRCTPAWACNKSKSELKLRPTRWFIWNFFESHLNRDSTVAAKPQTMPSSDRYSQPLTRESSPESGSNTRFLGRSNSPRSRHSSMLLRP
jgi:hypothetical protein